MSFGGSGRSSSFTRRGGSTQQRKEKKKKQEFHKHKIPKSLEEQSQPDFEALKTRVTVALDKLGKQVFSAEPGGYSFHNWMMSFNLLLDDFEEKSDPQNLPKEYLDKRLELTSELLKPVDTSDLDLEIAKIVGEEEKVKKSILEHNAFAQQEMQKEREEMISKLDALEKEQAKYSKELEMQPGKTKTSKDKEKQQQPFFKKLFGSRSEPRKSSQKSMEDLETKLSEVQVQIDTLKKEEDSRAQKANEFTRASAAEIEQKLESLRRQMAELEGRKLERMQLSEKRQEITVQIAEIISKIQIQTSQDRVVGETPPAENTG